MTKILFTTSSAFTLPILQHIHETALSGKLLHVYNEQCNVLGIDPLTDNILDHIEVEVLTYPSRVLRGKTLPHPILDYCHKHSIPCHTSDDLTKAKERIGKIDMGIVASFGKILKKDILEWPTYGWINWHPSALPTYRGASPMQATLEHGDPHTALSWIQMGQGMDDGDLWLKTPVTLHGLEDFDTLSKHMGELGSQSWTIPLVHQIASIEDKAILPTKQIGTPTFVKKIAKEYKFVDHTSRTASEIYNHWRAYKTFPGTVVSTKQWGDIKLSHIEIPSTIAQGTVLFESPELEQIKSSSTVSTYLMCADQSYLKLNQIILESGKKIDLKGYTLNS